MEIGVFIVLRVRAAPSHERDARDRLSSLGVRSRSQTFFASGNLYNPTVGWSSFFSGFAPESQAGVFVSKKKYCVMQRLCTTLCTALCTTLCTTTSIR